MYLTKLWPWNEVKVVKPKTTNVDPEQDYNHAKFERFRFNGVRGKVNIKVFFSNEELSQLSPLNACESLKEEEEEEEEEEMTYSWPTWRT